MSTEYSVTLAGINQGAFTALQKMYEEQEPEIQQDFTQLGAFAIGLNQRVNELQGGKIEIPEEQELKTEEEARLKQYWELHATTLKTRELMRCQQGVMNLLNQPPRAIDHQTQLESSSPGVWNELSKVDQAAQAMFKTLQQQHEHLESICQKMDLQMKTTAWEMMKFSDIVGNKGQPLSTMRRMYNSIGTPIVRRLRPEAQPLVEAASSTTGTDSDSIAIVDDEG